MFKHPPIFEVFDIQRDMGIDKASFVEHLRPTFVTLHLDPYDAKRDKVAFLKKRFSNEAARLDQFLARYYAGQADLESVIDLIKRLDPPDMREFDRTGMTGRRKRSIANFVLTHDRAEKHSWGLDRRPVKEFVQLVGGDEARKLVRTFNEAPSHVVGWQPMEHLMVGIASRVRQIVPDAKQLSMNYHQVQIYADLMSHGDNSPEGIHQDGADFIVSALVIERAGIIGGESIVYAEDRETVLLRRVLEAGEGLFQDDRTLWHYVTPVREDPSVPPDYGHRSILGFDITIL